MKKLIIASAMFGSMMFAVPSAEAKSAGSSATADATVSASFSQPGRRWGNRPVRTVNRTRVTRVGRYRYRETIRTTYYRNGRTRTQVIRRVRLGRG